MNRPGLALVAVLALFAPEARAEDKYLGTITSTGASKNNSDTATPFNATGFDMRALLAIQCDAAAYVRPVAASTGTVSSTNGEWLGPNILFDIDLNSASKFLAIISVSGTANCKVFARI